MNWLIKMSVMVEVANWDCSDLRHQGIDKDWSYGSQCSQELSGSERCSGTCWTSIRVSMPNQHRPMLSLLPLAQAPESIQVLQSPEVESGAALVAVSFALTDSTYQILAARREDKTQKDHLAGEIDCQGRQIKGAPVTLDQQDLPCSSEDKLFSFFFGGKSLLHPCVCATH